MPKKKPATAVFQVRIDADLNKALIDLAQKKRRSKNSLIQEAVAEFLKGRAR
jgi:predicted transcriptional regulator